MIYLLDTNACIVYLNRRMSGVRQRLETLPPEDVAVCSIVKAELFYGAMRSNNPEGMLAMQQEFLNLFVSLPFDDEAALIYGRIRAQLAALGTPIGAYDLQIAAIAITNNLILVTHNTCEFSRVEGLYLEPTFRTLYCHKRYFRNLWKFLRNFLDFNVRKTIFQFPIPHCPLSPPGAPSSPFPCNPSCDTLLCAQCRLEDWELT